MLSLAMGKKVKITVDVTELGRKGGRARAKKLTSAERRESARKAIQARWEKYYQAHPEKLKTKRSAAARKKSGR